MTSENETFLIIKDVSTSRRFKVKFRSREEFFAVTVSKLRRAVLSAVSHNDENELGHDDFYLEFYEQQKPSQVDENKLLDYGSIE